MGDFFFQSQIFSFGTADVKAAALYYYDNVSAAFWYFWLTIWIPIVYLLDAGVFAFAWPYYLVRQFLIYTS